MSGLGQPPRVLYDYQWVREDCLGVPPPGTNLDTSFACYSTNYLILVVGVGAAAMTWLEPPTLSKWLRVAAFGLTGLGYGLAGILHQFLVTEELAKAGDLAWRVSYALTILGVLPLTNIANLALEAKLGCALCCRWVGLGILAVLGVLVLGATFMLPSPPLVVVGAFMGFCLFYFVVVSAVVCDCGCAAGAATMIIGMVVQFLLAPVCGNAGYEDCFRDCPLPAPWFNHNALFHLIFAIGLLMLAAVMALMEARFNSEKFLALATTGL